MKRSYDAILFLFATIVIFAATFTLELPVAYNLDFFPVYGQLRGMFHGISFYREADLYQWLIEQYSLPASSTEIPPLAQPPWYYIILSPLAAFDLQTAAKIWFALCCVMICASVLLLTTERHRYVRGAAFLLSFFFPPIVGHLIVGQFALPVLFGAALITWGLRYSSNLVVAIGLALTTLKPHLGLTIILTTLAYLFFRERRRTFSVVKQFATIMLILLVTSWIVDPLWLSKYPDALSRVGMRQQNVSCDTCISLTHSLSGYLEWENSKKWRVGMELMLLAFAILGALVARMRSLSTDTLIAIAGLIALIFIPYVRNYDAIMALPAFVALADSRAQRTSVLLAAACYIAVFLMIFGQLRGSWDNLLWIPFALLLFINLKNLSRASSK